MSRSQFQNASRKLLVTVAASIILAAAIVWLNFGIVHVNSQATAPRPLRSDVQVRHIVSAGQDSIRITKDPRTNTLYYIKATGEIYQLDLAATTATSALVYTAKDHNASGVQGMAIGPDGAMYLVDNQDVDEGRRTRATIIRGAFDPETGGRVWSVLAQTAAYPNSNTAYDHKFNGIAVDPSNTFVYVNSGSRTGHGEVQAANGLFPGTREVGLTACILRLPVDGQQILLENDREALRRAGYVFADGTRNTFDMAFAPNGDLFGTENGSDRDTPDELNWLRPDLHYGFPWRIGGSDNPQQYPGYDPAADLLLSQNYYGVRSGFFTNDPSFPAPPPMISFVEPIRNVGPDADIFRDAGDGQAKDASDLGQSISTFSAHRSPLGLVFDTEAKLSREFEGDGFMLSWSKGDPTGATEGGPFYDASEDMLHLELSKVGADNYEVRATRIVEGFRNPLDAEIIGNKIYVLEYGGSQDIWEVTLPGRQTHIVPGLIQAEDYDTGGQTVGYYDTTPGNEGGEYRGDDVDIKRSGDAGSGYAVGWFAAGEWLTYTVDVQQAGTYNIYVRVGSAVPDRTFRIEVNGRDVSGEISVPNLSEWDRYETVRVSGVALNRGQQVVRVEMGAQSFMDINWLSFVRQASSEAAPEASLTR